mgnify:CR=1 FL=1
MECVANKYNFNKKYKFHTPSSENKIIEGVFCSESGGAMLLIYLQHKVLVIWVLIDNRYDFV